MLFDCEKCINKDFCKYVETVNKSKGLDHYLCRILSIQRKKHVQDADKDCKRCGE